MFYNRDGTFHGVEGTVNDEDAENLYQVRWWETSFISELVN
jgi:hypothetical protein